MEWRPAQSRRRFEMTIKKIINSLWMTCAAVSAASCNQTRNCNLYPTQTITQWCCTYRKWWWFRWSELVNDGGSPFSPFRQLYSCNPVVTPVPVVVTITESACESPPSVSEFDRTSSLRIDISCCWKGTLFSDEVAVILKERYYQSAW